MRCSVTCVHARAYVLPKESCPATVFSSNKIDRPGQECWACTLSSGFKLHDSKYSPLLGGVLKLLESILCLSVINRRGIICSCSHCKNKLVKEGGEVKSHLISGTGAPSDGCKSWRTSNRKSTAKCFHRRQITGQGLIIWGRGHYHQVRVVLTQSGPRSLMICLLIGISNSCCALYISREGVFTSRFFLRLCFG